MSAGARELAYKILKDAKSDATYSNIAIDNALRRCELSEADRGLFTVIVMGVTERRITLDHVIDRLAADPKRIDHDTRTLLRMGVYQMLFLDKVPDFAAINETVELAPRRSRGFVIFVYFCSALNATAPIILFYNDVYYLIGNDYLFDDRLSLNKGSYLLVGLCRRKGAILIRIYGKLYLSLDLSVYLYNYLNGLISGLAIVIRGPRLVSYRLVVSEY